MSDLWTRAFAQDLQQQWLLGAYDTPLYLSIKTTCEKVRCWLEESRQFADTWARAGYEKRRALQSANMMLRDTNTPVELLPSFYERTTEAGARRYWERMGATPKIRGSWTPADRIVSEATRR